jgi:hypothetical protein
MFQRTQTYDQVLYCMSTGMNADVAIWDPRKTKQVKLAVNDQDHLGDRLIDQVCSRVFGCTRLGTTQCLYYDTNTTNLAIIEMTS